MARLIVKSPYIKCGGEKSAGGYLEYIATRERVEIIPDDRPPTQKQTQLIEKLVKDFPDAKELMEYEDYLSHPTKALQGSDGKRTYRPQERSRQPWTQQYHSSESASHAA